MAVRKERKKMTYEELERHTINWAVDQLSEIREYTFEIEDDEIFTDEKRFVMFCNLAKPVDDLLCLLAPLRHDATCLVEWGFRFLEEYNKSDYSNRETN